MEQYMTERTVWQELNETEHGELVVIYDDGVALVDDGQHLWLADAALLRKAISWAGVTPADDHYAHEPYAVFFGQCPGYVVDDIQEGDGFPLDVPACVVALHRSGHGDRIPAHWDRDEEAF